MTNKISPTMDYVIVAVLFLLVSSDWFDGWLRSMFNSVNNGIIIMLIKTGVFTLLYFLYHYFAEIMIVDKPKEKST